MSRGLDSFSVVPGVLGSGAKTPVNYFPPTVTADGRKEGENCPIPDLDLRYSRDWLSGVPGHRLIPTLRALGGS